MHTITAPALRQNTCGREIEPTFDQQVYTCYISTVPDSVVNLPTTAPELRQNTWGREIEPTFDQQVYTYYTSTIP